MFKITLSAGHGLHTAGKRTPDGMHEWEFNSKVVSYMIDLLSHYKEVAVKRLDDPSGAIDIPLQKRVKTSNNWGANFHLDVHANASGDGVHWNDGHGIESYSFGLSGKSHDIAVILQKHLIKETGLFDRGVLNGDWLYMLRNTKAPACLVECGFMTNKAEATLLKSDSYRKRVAGALVDGIAEAFKLTKVKPVEPVISYVIKKGDTLTDLAIAYNTTINKIMKLNPSITNPSKINAGQKIKLPDNR